MQIHDIRPKVKFKSKKRLGRGGNRGKTSGRGTKGQKARAGHRIRPEFRDFIKKIPKRRGFGKNRTQSLGLPPSFFEISLSMLNAFSDGDTVSPKTLREKGFTSRSIRIPEVKILGNGEINKKLIIMDCRVSASARSKIEKAGGTIKDLWIIF